MSRLMTKPTKWHPPSLVRVFAVRVKKPWGLSYPLSAQRRLIRLILLVLSCSGSFVIARTLGGFICIFTEGAKLKFSWLWPLLLTSIPWFWTMNYPQARLYKLYAHREEMYVISSGFISTRGVREILKPGHGGKDKVRETVIIYITHQILNTKHKYITKNRDKNHCPEII